MIPEAERAEVDEPFFWENEAARAGLLAQADLVTMEDSASDSDAVETRVVVKRLSQMRSTTAIAETAAAKWTKSELYTQRLRKRDWRVRHDRLDASGSGDHRAIVQ